MNCMFHMPQEMGAQRKVSKEQRFTLHVDF